MSFIPLPPIFQNDLKNATSGVVEIGSGEGRLTDLMRETGAPVVALDLDRSNPAQIIGDACRPPIRAGSLQMLVAANLLRHLRATRDLSALIGIWTALLRPGGSLWILEDEPDTTSPATRNHHDLQVFLARLYPRQRGALLPLADFKSEILKGTVAAESWRFGILENTYSLDDPTNLLKMLSAVSTDKTAESRRLATAIRREGLDYGAYWWARYQWPMSLDGETP